MFFDFEDRYYKYAKCCFKFSGLWFDQSDHKTQLFFVTWQLVMIVTIIIPQITMLTREYRNTTILIANIVHLTFFIGGTLVYSALHFKKRKLKAVYTKIASDWQDIESKSERAILQRYNEEGLWLSKWFTIAIFAITAATSSKPFFPLVANLIVPLENGTRSLEVPLYSDHIFFNQSDHLLVVSAYTALAYAFLMPFWPGVSAFFLTAMKHTCGLFAVTCKRIEKALDVLHDGNILGNSRKEAECRQNLIDAIVLHNGAIRSVQLLEDSFDVCIVLIVVFCNVGLGICLTFITYAHDEFILILTAIIVGGVMLLYLLITSWLGQQLIDGSEQIFYSAYFSNWYIAPVTTRKYIYVIMMRSNYPCKINGIARIDVSMQTFSTVLRTAWSYFTVLLSLM